MYGKKQQKITNPLPKLYANDRIYNLIFCIEFGVRRQTIHSTCNSIHFAFQLLTMKFVVNN